MRWCWPARWWCTARVSTPAPSTAYSSRPRGAGQHSTRATSRTTARTVAGHSRGSSSPRTRGSTRGAATRPARSPRSTTPSRGHDRRGSRAIGLRYHNVYGPGMPRDTPYSGVAAIFRSSLEAGRAPQVFEDGGQMRDFVHVQDVARANVLSIDAVLERPAESWAAYNVCSGQPVSILRVAQLLARGVRRPRPAGERGLSARRRPPRRRLSGSRGRGARVHGDHCAGAGSPRVRDCSPAPGCHLVHSALRFGDHHPVKSRCCTTSAKTTCTTTPTRRQRSGSKAQEISSQGTNGSQMRSTSALLICDTSASRTIDHTSTGKPSDHPHRVRAQVEVAIPYAEHGQPGADERTRAEHQCRKVAPAPSTPPGDGSPPRPSSAHEGPARPPTTRTRVQQSRARRRVQPSTAHGRGLQVRATTSTATARTPSSGSP